LIVQLIKLAERVIFPQTDSSVPAAQTTASGAKPVYYLEA
jgi:hypothetical protein